MINSKNKYLWILGGLAVLTIGGLMISKKKEEEEVVDNFNPNSSFKKKLIGLANQEYSKWNKNGKKIKEGSKDTIQDLRNYWQQGANVFDNDKYYVSEAWSSAFISYLMKKAGAGDDFSYSKSHSVYIRDAIKNRKEKNNKKFKGFKPEEVNVNVGDLVCYPREKGVNYDTDYAYKSHCDLITQISGNVATGIGGNISDSVSKKTYNLSNGKIDKKKSSGVFVVVKNLK
jgi:hypothetical protein